MATRNANIESRLKELREATYPHINTEEVVKIVEDVIVTLGHKKENKDTLVLEHMQTLMMTIQQMRDEVTMLKPADVTEYDIPSVQDELDAIVKGTEVATNSILDKTEEIQSLAGAISDEELKNQIMSKATEIFEACNFQDITGQRIDKVVKTLQIVETTLNKMMKAFGVDEADMAIRRDKPDTFKTDDDLLAGPQTPETANSQDDIDAILASFN